MLPLEQLDLFEVRRIKKKNREKEKLLGSLFLRDQQPSKSKESTATASLGGDWGGRIVIWQTGVFTSPQDSEGESSDSSGSGKKALALCKAQGGAYGRMLKLMVKHFPN